MWRMRLERSMYPKYGLQASSIKEAIDQMANFIVLLLEWQVEGYVLEEAAGGHIYMQPWWLTLTTRPDTDKAAASLAKTDTWLCSEEQGGGAGQSDTVGLSGPCASECGGLRDDPLIGKQYLFWRGLANGVASLEEIRNGYRHELAFAMELQAAGYEVDCDAVPALLECRRPDDPVSSDEEDD